MQHLLFLWPVIPFSSFTDIYLGIHLNIKNIEINMFFRSLRLSLKIVKCLALLFFMQLTAYFINKRIETRSFNGENKEIQLKKGIVF